MPDSSRHIAIMLAIAALDETADRAHNEVLTPTLELRALLALLHTLSTGERKSYGEYWRYSHRPVLEGQSPSIEGYVRSTNMRIAMKGIMRSLGLEPQSMELGEVIYEIRRKQRETLNAKRE